MQIGNSSGVMRKKDKIVVAIVAVSVLIENYLAFRYFGGERGFFDLLLCGIFVHIPVGLVVWAIANNCIRDDVQSKAKETAPDTRSNMTQVKDGEQRRSSSRECNETKVENPENAADSGLLIIPGTVHTIMRKAYAGDLQLKKVVLMDGVSTIEDYAFKGCKNLRCIKIPSSVKIIGYDIFDGCEQLMRIEVDDLHSWLGVSCRHSRYGLFSGVPSHDLVVGGKILEKVELDETESVCPANRDAFRQCSSIKEVMFSHSTKRIVMSFANCENLKRVVLPECLDFWHCDFWECRNLTEVSLPKNVKEIFRNPFLGVPNVVEIENGLEYLCGWCVGGSAQGNVSVRFRDGTCGIAQGIARDSSDSFCTVRELIFPQSVKCVGAESFRGVDELRRIIFEGRTPVCGERAFEKLSGRDLIEVVVNDGDWKHVAKQFANASRFVIVDANIRREILERDRDLGIIERPNSPRWILICCALCRSCVSVDRYYLASKLDAGVSEMTCPVCGGSFLISHVQCPLCGKCHVYGEDVEGRHHMPGAPEYDYCSRCGNKIKVHEAYFEAYIDPAHEPHRVSPLMILQEPAVVYRSGVQKWLYNVGCGMHYGIREVLRTKGYSEDEFVYRVAQMVKVSGRQITDALTQLDSMYIAGHRERLIEVVTAIMQS